MRGSTQVRSLIEPSGSLANPLTGAPLFSQTSLDAQGNSKAIGTLCIVDNKPHASFSYTKRASLYVLPYSLPRANSQSHQPRSRRSSFRLPPPLSPLPAPPLPTPLPSPPSPNPLALRLAPQDSRRCHAWLSAPPFPRPRLRRLPRSGTHPPLALLERRSA